MGAAVACAGGGRVTADPGDLWPRCSFGRDPRGVHLLKLGPHKLLYTCWEHGRQDVSDQCPVGWAEGHWTGTYPNFLCLFQNHYAGKQTEEPRS